MPMQFKKATVLVTVNSVKNDHFQKKSVHPFLCLYSCERPIRNHDSPGQIGVKCMSSCFSRKIDTGSLQLLIEPETPRVV